MRVEYAGTEKKSSSTLKNNVSSAHETKDSRITRRNKEVYGIAYVFVLVFLGMAVYFVWFLIVRGEQVQDNTYNPRVAKRSERVVRGDIYSSDGVLLAYTRTAQDGTEERVYPYSNEYAHVVGYVMNGGLGAERSYQYELLSSHMGIESMIRWELLGEKEQGDSLYLTIDSGLQSLAYELLGELKGAIVAVEPSTGRILAMVSKPDYDPNTLEENWGKIVADEAEESPLLNRVTMGMYPPGSTFKILTSLEYYRENEAFQDDIMYECDGIYVTAYGNIRCSELAAHGEMRLSNGLAMSCNGIFAQIGSEMNVTQFVSLCDDFMFGKKLTEELDVSASRIALNSESSEWIRMQTAIGQGETLMTPLHQAMIAATIANDGVMMTPMLADRVENKQNLPVTQYEQDVLATPITAGEAQWLTDMMVNVVENGTGYKAASENYSVAGKTGSAQFENSERTHAIFVGFAPADNPRIALCVLLEGGGSGGNVAAPIASELFEYYIEGSGDIRE